jgi:RNA polymerase sigma factor (sigma-70 family)
MGKNAVASVLRRLRTLAAGQVADGQADPLLLERFARQRDEAAFAALLERHGPMVLGVCRRALRDEHLAEDVLQATFLVLVRNAGAIRNRACLGGWLHGVAVRLVRKAKAQAARAAGGRERPGPEAPPGPAAEASWREVRQLLDEELQRLPESYRLPLVLCYLEGRTRDEAAAELGWTPGRLKGLLERGRERLRERLLRRGLAPAAAAAALLAETALAAPVPPLLAVATLRAALRLAAGDVLEECGVSGTVARLTEGGLGIMGSKKLVPVLVLALGLSVLGTGAGLLAQRPAAATPPAKGGQNAPDLDPPKGQQRAAPVDAGAPVPGSPPPLELTRSDAGKVVRATVGQTILVRLDYPAPKGGMSDWGTKGSITPGKCASHIPNPDETIVKRYQDAGLLGPRTGLLQFRAIAAGQDQLKIRLWERATNQVLDFAVTLEVRAAARNNQEKPGGVDVPKPTAEEPREAKGTAEKGPPEDQSLIPPPLNSLLPTISAGMTPKEVKKLLSTAYPKVEYRLGVWSGQTGYLDFQLNDRYTVSVAGSTDPERGTVVHPDIHLYVFDHPNKQRVEIKQYHWKDQP